MRTALLNGDSAVPAADFNRSGSAFFVIYV
jgi:hypothetical protein